MEDFKDLPNKPIEHFIRPVPGKLPELFVPAGGQAEADARRYEFSRVTIENFGSLSLRPKAREALQFVVDGDMVLRGEIYLWDSASEERETNLTFPDGKSVIFAYRNRSRGGDGGTGQGFSQDAVSARGGRGARGTTQAGGGGGGGGSATFREGHGGGWERPTNGENANDDRGAFGGAPMGGTGGDGAERDAYKTGGMLYLLVNGDFDGGGIIFANGNNGSSGEHGKRATQPGYGGTSLGGGGGGGPGGNGGFVAIYVSGQVASWPGTYLSGGEGGGGGNPSGGRGDNGASGFAEFRAKNPAPAIPAPLTEGEAQVALGALALRWTTDQQRENTNASRQIRPEKPQ